MTPAALVAWRARLGYSRAQAAAALGISPSQIADYETGIKRGTARPAPIPRVVELACVAIESSARAGTHIWLKMASKRNPDALPLDTPPAHDPGTPQPTHTRQAPHPANRVG